MKDLQRRRRLNAGMKVVFTNGVFDILHAGHVHYLKFSRDQGDVLVVGVNSDDSVKRLKGPSRPVNGLVDRMAVLAGLQAVAYVVSFPEDTPMNLINAIKPDVLIKGADYQPHQVVGWDFVRSYGGKLVLVPVVPGRNTTNIIRKIAAPRRG